MGADIFQSPVVVITALSLAAVLVVMVYTLTCWRQRNMMYFAFLTIAVSVNVLGYYLEVTSTTLEAAIVACKVAYVGAPLTGILLFMFSLDYSDRIKLNGVIRVILFAIAPVFTLAVLLYPESTIFYQDLVFSTEGLTPHLIVTPGLLYYPCLIYASAFTVLAFVNLMIAFFRQKDYEGTIIFIVAICFPLLVLFYTTVFGLVDGWNPQRSSMAVSVVLLTIYLVRYKQAEWQSKGRGLVVQDMNDAFILLDTKGMVIDRNLSAEAYFPELKGRQRLRLADIWEFPPENYTSYAVHQIDMQREGTVRNLKVTTSPLVANGKTTGTLVVINDDTVNNQLIQELTRMARIDELTGLNNRATFFHDASLSFELARRQNEEKGCALMMDIDFFKNVNDTFGHASGDEVLAYMGSLLRSRFRRTDICGRYGGEELSVWMPATSLAGSLQVAEEIRAAVEEKVFQHDNSYFGVTISIGIACISQADTGDFEDLLKKADDALYEAKETGRNRICTYTCETTPRIWNE
ncbi:MAG: diguanylate cyclase [Coriobacteriales bacterium]|nr:diguanylate cyclase [Coriobacteriales bacterium]